MFPERSGAAYPPAPSPDAIHTRLVENAFVRDQGNILDQRLRYEQPIKGVLVGDGEAARQDRMRQGHSQPMKSMHRNLRFEIQGKKLRFRELAPTMLADDLESGNGAYQDIVRVFNL